MGAGMAELLAGEGHAVELVTSCEKVAPFCDETLEGPLLRQHLYDLGIGMRAECAVSAVDAGGVRGETTLGDPFEIECDAVVLVTQRLSDERLFLELGTSGTAGLHRIGDCVAPLGSRPPTRSGTATGSPARSTRLTRRCRSRTSASARPRRSPEPEAPALSPTIRETLQGDDQPDDEGHVCRGLFLGSGGCLSQSPRSDRDGSRLHRWSHERPDVSEGVRARYGPRGPCSHVRPDVVS